jgi:phenylalanine-4-hydroxylase
MEIRPLDFAEMASITYDITNYQPILYAAPSMDGLEDELGSFFGAVDDETPGRLQRSSAALPAR